MLSGVKVFCRVLVLGRITASDMAALEAEPEVNPAIAGFETFLAALGCAGCDLLDQPQVGACWHGPHPDWRFNRVRGSLERRAAIIRIS